MTHPDATPSRAGAWRGAPVRAVRGRRALRVAAALLVLCVGCASRNGPAYPDFAASAPPIPPGHARLVVYRTLYTPPEVFHAQITVDAAPVGTLPIGTWLWVDEPAGQRRVDSPLWPAYSAFGAQLPTQPIELELVPGTTSFVSVNVPPMAPLRVSLEPVGPDRAARDLATLELAPPPSD